MSLDVAGLGSESAALFQRAFLKKVPVLGDKFYELHGDCEGITQQQAVVLVDICHKVSHFAL